MSTAMTTTSAARSTGGDVIIEAKDLVKHYPIKGGVLRRTVGHVKAVDGVSFELRRGETLGIVGESGCGKSTLGRLLMRLEDPTSGTVTFDGLEMYEQSGSAMRKLRRDIQIVFQDPYTSLNPRKTVGDIVGEPFDIHPDAVPKGGRRAAVQELLDLVGLNPEHINRYPHQFSGGQRQRIGIARGIALRPKVLVCDEPVSALDVSVQAQVVNLMEELQDQLGLSYVFIAHDLSVVRHISDRVAVMYLGKIVEFGTEDEIYERPTHPYTQALLSAVPVPTRRCAANASRSCCTATCPRPRTRRRGAASTPAAGRRRKSAAPRSRGSSTVPTAPPSTAPPATSPACVRCSRIFSLAIVRSTSRTSGRRPEGLRAGGRSARCVARSDPLSACGRARRVPP